MVKCAAGREYSHELSRWCECHLSVTYVCRHIDLEHWYLIIETICLISKSKCAQITSWRHNCSKTRTMLCLSYSSLLISVDTFLWPIPLISLTKRLKAMQTLVKITQQRNSSPLIPQPMVFFLPRVKRLGYLISQITCLRQTFCQRSSSRNTCRNGGLITRF